MKPNILFIIIDAFRSDRCFGEDKTSKTPNMDSLIEKGVLFENAFSSADNTEISLSSIFTGLYPFKCAIRGGIWNSKLTSDSKTFVSFMKEQGYTVHCTVPNMWNAKDFDFGFENEDKSYPLFDRLESGAGEKILKKLSSDSLKEPWLYYIHLLDLHKPIEVPKEFDDEKFGIDEYDKMISVVDLWLGKILNKVDLSNTLVVLTSDHGDYLPSIKVKDKTISFGFQSLAPIANMISKITPLFLYSLKIKLFLFVKNIATKRKLQKIESELSPYQKRSILHSRSEKDRYLYDELFHVPLILSGYGIKQNKKKSSLVRSIDIFPTIKKIAHLSDKMENVHGRSLLSILEGKELEEVPVYLESNIDLQKSEGAIGIRSSKFKYFRNISGKNQKVHLYDLDKDPFEENNIASKESEIVEKMEKQLQEIMDETATIPAEEYNNEMTEEEHKKVEDELRKLGYI